MDECIQLVEGLKEIEIYLSSGFFLGNLRTEKIINDV